MIILISKGGNTLPNSVGIKIKNTVFIRLLMKLIFTVFLITLITGTLFYLYFYNTLKEQAYNSNIEILGQTKNMIELVLEDVHKTAISMALSNDINRVIWHPWQINEDYYSLKDIQDAFNQRIFSSNYIYSIYFYSKNSGKVLTNSGVMYLDEFADKSIIEDFRNSKSFSTWLNKRSIRDYNGSDEQVITCIINIPITDNFRNGILVINIKESLFYNAVLNINNYKLGNVAIIDKEGNYISYKNENSLQKLFMDEKYLNKNINSKKGYYIENLEGQNMFISYLTSDFNGWRYITINPSAEIFKNPVLVIKTMIFISILCFIIGLIMMLFISKGYYNSVKGLVDLVSNRTVLSNKPNGNRIEKDEFQYIKESFNNLMDENKEFKQTFINNQLILKEHFLIELILGRKNNIEDIKNQIKHYNIDFNLPGFVVMVFHILYDNIKTKSDNEKSIIHYQVHNICEVVMNSCYKGIVIDSDQNHFIIIINLNYEDKESNLNEIREIALKLRKNIKSTIPLNITIGIGNIYKNVLDVSLSYREAIEALAYEKIGGEDSITTIEDVLLGSGNENLKNIYNYEKKILEFANEIKLGDLKKTKAISDYIINGVYTDKSCNCQQKNMVLMQLVNSIVSAVIRINGNIDEALKNKNYNLYYEFGKLNSIDDIRLWFENILTKVNQYIKSKRENKNMEIIDKITDYIKWHYKEPINIQDISDRIYMNHTYFCKVFKERTGKTFVEYLTEIRINNACKLLSNTNKNIAYIGCECGFGGNLNFMRAFKKSVSMTPTEFRNSKAAQNFEV